MFRRQSLSLLLPHNTPPVTYAIYVNYGKVTGANTFLQNKITSSRQCSKKTQPAMPNTPSSSSPSPFSALSPTSAPSSHLTQRSSPCLALPPSSQQLTSSTSYHLTSPASSTWTISTHRPPPHHAVSPQGKQHWCRLASVVDRSRSIYLC